MLSGPVNPSGYMGIGVVIINAYNETSYKDYNGWDENIENTNNKAEYLALEHILECLKDEVGKTIVIHGDSLLVIHQMNLKWKIKSGAYSDVAKRCLLLSTKIKNNNSVKYVWIPREENTEADELSKMGIKQAELRNKQWNIE